ncbi:MAG: iron complex outermembrane receptor protein [Candidatus Azotimanducaceae bacterium]|jgi:iron complex outermembrane receptor protein
MSRKFSQTKAFLMPAMLILPILPVNLLASDGESHREAHQHFIEEVIVSAPFSKSTAETSQPINVLAGEALLEEVANSLGATLAGEIGINSASYGPSVGHPVIRGHTGNRVGILQNGVGTTDVANQSPDHAEGVDVSLAERIEIIRGPASLLYGSGAIGGVVNVIDGKIPERVPESLEVFLEQTHNFNYSENRSVFSLDAGSGNFAFHVEGFSRSNDNVEIPGFAIDEAAVEALEELLHGNEEEEEEEELENTRGFIGNSDSDSKGGAVGFSLVNNSGFIGLSVSRLENAYGLPPGTHAHAHGHEEGEDPAAAAEEEEEVEFVRLEMEKTRVDLRAGYELEGSIIDSLRFSFAQTDYEHDEVEFFDTGEKEVGTTYTNEGYEGRFVLTHRAFGPWSGVAGVQMTNNDFEATGEEGFIPRSEIKNLGFFAFEQYQGDQFNVELGLRYDSNQVQAGRCESDEQEVSLSGSVLYSINDSSNVFFGLTDAARTPSVEELFANVDGDTCARQADNEDLVLHAATNLLEIGDPNLDPERSQNFEVGYRYHTGRITGEISAYVNDIEDYIFLNVTGAEFEEQRLAQFIARDAEFRGIEAQLNFSIYESELFGVTGAVFADTVQAEFAAGGNVPLIPAAKYGAEVEFYGESWTVHFHAIRVLEQDDFGQFELPTDGYNLLSMYADYHWDVGTDGELKLFLRGDNLGDEEVRNHASRLKNFAPDAGRSIQLGLRYTL